MAFLPTLKNNKVVLIVSHYVADDKHEFWFANVNILNYTIILITPYLL
jgi:hypothetical protein